MSRRTQPITKRKAVAASKRQALLVLGMHRSGTSAVAGVLARLGAQVPQTLMSPTKDNPKGYWESIAFRNFNDQLLKSAGSRWSDWQPFNADWSDSIVAEYFSEKLPKIIEQEFAGARLLLIKDPRICRFLPFWLRALERLRIEPKIVMPVRNPIEVAGSLQDRDGLGPAHSQLIWLRHVLEAEYGTRRVARSLIRYDRLLDDWRSQATKIATDLSLRWPGWSSSSEREIDEFLSTELRHHKIKDVGAGSDPDVRQWVSKTYRALQDLVDGTGSGAAARRTLDAVRKDLDRSGATFAAAMRQQDERIDKLGAESSKLRRQVQEQAQRVVDQEARFLAEELQHKLANAALEERIKQVQEQARRFVDQEARFLAEELQHKLANAALEERIKQGAGQVAQLSSTLERLQVENIEKASTLGELKRSHDELVAQAKQLSHKVEALSAASRDKERVVAETTENLKSAQASLATASAHLSAREAKIAELEADNRKLRVKNEEKAKAIATRFRELATLTKLLDERERAEGDGQTKANHRGSPSLSAIHRALSRSNKRS